MAKIIKTLKKNWLILLVVIIALSLVFVVPFFKKPCDRMEHIFNSAVDYVTNTGQQSCGYFEKDTTFFDDSISVKVKCDTGFDAYVNVEKGTCKIRGVSG